MTEPHHQLDIFKDGIDGDGFKLCGVELSQREQDTIRQAFRILEKSLRTPGAALTSPNLEIKTRTKKVTNKRGDMMLVNSDTGEVQSNVAGFWEAHEVDSTKFVKLFVNGVKALKELSGAGTKVFEVLYLRVQENIGSDQVYMGFKAVDQVITPMSEPTYNRGMRELIAKEFIAATPSQGLYWLNPSFVWNGDRLAFVQEYRKVRTNASITETRVSADEQPKNKIQLSEDEIVDMEKYAKK